MKYLFYLAALELSLMGSGQAISYHGFSLRMALFIILVGYGMYKTKWSDTSLRNILVFVSILLFASLVGIAHHASTAYILNDIKPLLFLLYIFPINYFFEDEKNREVVIRIIKISSIVLAVFYLIYVALVLIFPVIKLLPVFMESHGEVFFRPGGLFFYKGFLTLMVGFILYVYSNSKFRWIICGILLTAIILTLTRGLMAALAGTFLLYYLIDLFWEKRISTAQLVLAPFILIVLIFGISYVIALYGDKAASDAIRFQTIDQVFENMNAFALLFGHGFGIGVEIREVHMEIAFLEIWHKQGLIGISFWMFLYIQSFLYYRNSNALKEQAKPFFLIITSVYLISFTNPFVNNPIGLYPLLVSLICLKIINDKSFGVHSHIQRKEFYSGTN